MHKVLVILFITSYFVGYIGCKVPFFVLFSDILELVTYRDCYWFEIPIIILVSTFLCFTVVGMVCSDF